MKLRHKVNHNWSPPASPLHSDPIDDRYEARVQTDTAQAERRVRKAEERLAKAEARLAKVQSSKKTANRKRQLAELAALVELRRQELEEYRRLMVAVPASAEHRGKRSFRPISFGGPS